jgi:transposase
VKASPDPVLYSYKKEQLAHLEVLSQQGMIDLFYGDESHVCSTGYVPYGWQFPGERVCIAAQKGFKLNCWGLISRQNHLHWATTRQSITAAFVAEQLDQLSWQIHKPTVVVLDNARVHTCGCIKQLRSVWQSRGLYVFYLPPYSPHLNIAETLWRHLKGGWLKPEDYATEDDLAYALNRCMANVGKVLTIKFSQFNAN